MELSKMNFPNKDNLTFRNDFERWCYFFKYEGYLKEDEMRVLLGDNPYIQEAHKLYTTFTADQAMLDRLEAKEKWRRDYLSGLDESWNDGMEKGIEKGITQTAKGLKGRRSRHGTHHQGHRPKRRRDPRALTETNLPNAPSPHNSASPLHFEFPTVG